MRFLRARRPATGRWHRFSVFIIVDDRACWLSARARPTHILRDSVLLRWCCSEKVRPKHERDRVCRASGWASEAHPRAASHPRQQRRPQRGRAARHVLRAGGANADDDDISAARRASSCASSASSALASSARSRSAFCASAAWRAPLDANSAASFTTSVSPTSPPKSKHSTARRRRRLGRSLG